MSIRKFQFSSPSIKFNEVDNSQLPANPTETGPVIIGRAERGPVLRPITVKGFQEFVEMFGNPVAGGLGGDVWRDGNYTAPTYGAYAAQAWLKNQSQVTFVRLGGIQDANATTAGQAGWQTTNTINTAEASNGGAYGLFVVDSGSANITGTLAAVWYLNEGSIELSGSDLSDAVTGSAATFIKSVGDKEFRATIRNAAGTTAQSYTFNFNKNSEKYIRKVFNTNPVLVNSSVTNTANIETYWLGESYERAATSFLTASGAGLHLGAVVGLGSSSVEKGVMRGASKAPRTGWFISQDLTTDTGSYSPEAMTQLFQFVGLDNGEWEGKKFKVSVEDIRVSTNESDPYGSFTVTVRQAQDNDTAVQVVERYTGCNLNPNSRNFIGEKIGDQYLQWNSVQRRYEYKGNFPNVSRFIRVNFNSDVEAGATDSRFLPFGVYGPAVFADFVASSGAAQPLDAFALGSGSIPRGPLADGVGFIETGAQAIDVKFTFPGVALRVSASTGPLANPTDAYFGADSTQADANVHDRGYGDLVYTLPIEFGTDPDAGSTSTLKHSWVFSLDDLWEVSGQAVYLSGSRSGSTGDGTSYTAASGTYTAVLDAGYDRFTSPLWGGFDGIDVKQMEPFSNTILDGGAETTDYAYASVKRAIDAVRDREEVPGDIFVIPGLTNETLTSHLLDVVESRGDGLAIIDLKGDYQPRAEGTSPTDGNLDTTITNLKQRGINNSYGAAFYPWVRARDTINGAALWVPPSIPALGALGFSEASSELWFAPAGFVRGGLSNGAGGIPVVATKERLRQIDRDKLYEANINPIAQFPSEGVVIFGQKTLQVTPSALDRINVRRLMNHAKRIIQILSKEIIFEPSIDVTWARFRSRVNPFLQSIKTRYGLVDFKVILDERTTTPDLIDRNVLYAQIFLQPTRSIEYIALDFAVTDSGTIFEE